jgi:hypothetical protein
MRTAFKEWAVVVDALGKGDQILILRKGGISETGGEFKPEHEKFLLFPTFFHQHRESVIDSAQSRFDLLAPRFVKPSSVRIEYHAELTDVRQLHTLEDALALTGQHVWREEVIRQRFDWGAEKAIFALAVRVHRLPRAFEIQMLGQYGGCKSWVELEEDVPLEGSRPVLDDADYQSKLREMMRALEKPQPNV